MSRILVIGGDKWHPMEIIKKGFGFIEDIADEITFIEDAKDILTKEGLRQYRLVINCKGDELTEGNDSPWFEEGVTEVTPLEIRQYIEEGGSFLAIHAGNAFNENLIEQDPRFLSLCTEYIHMTGCRFISHPPRCEVSIKKINSKHPIMNGVSEFTVRDEHYQVELVSDEIELLFETYSEHGNPMPGGYTKRLGLGKVCVLLPGHTASVWENHEYQKIITNAVKWSLSDG